MDNVDAADTSIFEKDGRWWMFTNLCSAKIRDHNSELHIFHQLTYLRVIGLLIPKSCNFLMLSAVAMAA